MIADLKARELALDPQRSFIVQAPAGSGKTALLVYRILTLLARVTSPEQVLAITFTRKATSEMRERLVELLRLAEEGTRSDDAFEQQGIDLATAVLHQSDKHGWQLLDTPQQMQLLTIDAFCGKLAGEMPWLSRLGDKPRTTDNAEKHYASAVDQVFKQILNKPTDLSAALKDVLFELDFNYAMAKKLFISMLARRDQWLRHLLQNDLGSLRLSLEESWSQLINEACTKLQNTLGQQGLLSLIRIAVKAEALMETKTTPLSAFSGLSADDVDATLIVSLNLQHWKGLVFLLTTAQAKGFRVQLNKNIGFPPQEKHHKAEFKTFLNEVCDDTTLLKALQEVYILPPHNFSDSDWEQILALEKVLLGLAAHLQLVFRSRGECDHSEVAQRANLALLERNAPTELALKLDSQIKHIMVDEFQDTSRSQLQLLQKLTAGWQDQESQNTVFFVGDPMQSIYRFREADVSLFLQVVNNTASKVFEHLDIESLTLSENFRSEKGLVDWFNSCFHQSFPTHNQFSTGAVRYASSTSNKAGGGEVIALGALNKQLEAQNIVESVQLELKQSDDVGSRIAILVRSRTHLPAIIELLEEAKIAYSGVDIQPLKETPAVIDLVSLCKAVCRLDNRVAWMSLLRGPWCGLNLSEIQVIVGDKSECIWEQIVAMDAQQMLNEDSAKRLVRFREIMREGLSQSQQVPLYSLCRWIWVSLGGPDTLFGTQMEDIDDVFSIIQNLESGGDLPSLAELDSALDNLYARPTAHKDCRVVVSTIHKAKGLQYNTVILPSLASKSRSDEKQLLMWTELSNVSGSADLLLAPIRLEQEEGAHYEYLRHIEKQKARNELIRLMYVACTRAEQKVVLSSVVKLQDSEQLSEGFKTPEATSLLSTIWDAVSSKFKNSVTSNIQIENLGDNPADLNQDLFRLPADYSAQFAEQFNWRNQGEITAINSSMDDLANEANVDTDANQEELEFDWASDMATAVGVVLHRWLEFNAPSVLSVALGPSLDALWRDELRKLNLPVNKMNAAMERLNLAIATMQNDDKARFIFAEHAEAQNEFSICAYENAELTNVRIDRTFVDQEGTRWIVDYKSTITNANNVSEFVDQQVELRHKRQLENYGRLMQELEQRPIRLAVYYPLLGEMRDWQYER